MIFLVVYCGQQVDSTAGRQTPLHCGRSYLPLDDMLLPPTEDIIDDRGQESDDIGEM